MADSSTPETPASTGHKLAALYKTVRALKEELEALEVELEPFDLQHSDTPAPHSRYDPTKANGAFQALGFYDSDRQRQVGPIDLNQYHVGNQLHHLPRYYGD